MRRFLVHNLPNPPFFLEAMRKTMISEILGDIGGTKGLLE